MNEAMSTRRVRFPLQYKNVFDELCESQGALFNSRAELMIFAAGVGYKAKKKTTFETTMDPIRFSVFEGLRFFFTVFNAIALSDKGDIGILAENNINERIQIFEEYACTGLKLISDTIINQPGKPFDNIINIFPSTQHIEDSKGNVLSDFNLDI